MTYFITTVLNMGFLSVTILIFISITSVRTNLLCNKETIQFTRPRTQFSFYGYREDVLSVCSDLEKINLSHNIIETVPEKMFYNNTKLQVINLSFNSILYIYPNTFTKNLLSYNLLYHFHIPVLISTISSYSHLNIAHNNIMEINSYDLCFLNDLK